MAHNYISIIDRTKYTKTKGNCNPFKTTYSRRITVTKILETYTASITTCILEATFHKCRSWWKYLLLHLSLLHPTNEFKMLRKINTEIHTAYGVFNILVNYFIKNKTLKKKNSTENSTKRDNSPKKQRLYPITSQNQSKIPTFSKNSLWLQRFPIQTIKFTRKNMKWKQKKSIKRWLKQSKDNTSVKLVSIGAEGSRAQSYFPTLITNSIAKRLESMINNERQRERRTRIKEDEPPFLSLSLNGEKAKNSGLFPLGIL